ncbi:AAA family ATPase [Budviciaceae bacterium CWB-B4]|uniref:AAA family ATPase n=1 Tax=Limnobaculum xujianqingii TaxID=2738837 RepID=A0A9D7FZG2_9GAMM|nr:AAA family ATPase [Limnobaculum xujianqingii]MBK5074805.1 AAA family ATPase [Limnobaculum xujianqingii]MBK5178115.1 AAA family ATPase [Limnobaculum xujianqingii]
MLNFQKRIVITGGPGSGKSTLIDALTQRGYLCSVEAGRSIIQDQISIGGNALPWGDRIAFSELMLCWEIRSWHAANGCHELCFFDRGIPDVAGYLSLCRFPVPAHVEKAINNFRYAGTVFIAPPWKEIYVQDSERKQSIEEAEQTYWTLSKTYQAYGYQLIEIPRIPADERADFIISQVSQKDFQ